MAREDAVVDARGDGARGQRRIVVEECDGWVVGDRLVVAPTGGRALLSYTAVIRYGDFVAARELRGGGAGDRRRGARTCRAARSRSTRRSPTATAARWCTARAHPRRSGKPRPIDRLHGAAAPLARGGEADPRRPGDHDRAGGRRADGDGVGARRALRPGRARASTASTSTSWASARAARCAASSSTAALNKGSRSTARTTRRSRRMVYDVRGASIYVEDGNEVGNLVKKNALICPSFGGGGLGGVANDGSGRVLQRCVCDCVPEHADSDKNEQAAIYVLSPSNDFVGNRVCGHENAFFSNHQGGRNWGIGAANGKVCLLSSRLAALRATSSTTTPASAGTSTSPSRRRSPRRPTPASSTTGRPCLPFNMTRRRRPRRADHCVEPRRVLQRLQHGRVRSGRRRVRRHRVCLQQQGAVLEELPPRRRRRPARAAHHLPRQRDADPGPRRLGGGRVPRRNLLMVGDGRGEPTRPAQPPLWPRPRAHRRAVRLALRFGRLDVLGPAQFHRRHRRPPLGRCRAVQRDGARPPHGQPRV